MAKAPVLHQIIAEGCSELAKEPVLKTGGGIQPLVSSSLTASAFWRWSCGLAAKAAPLQGDDRWFESTQDHSDTRTRHRSPTAEAVVSKATECEFESHRCQ